MNLLIAGDFFISDNYRGRSLFNSAVTEAFAGADYRIVNLEAPITAEIKQNRILKTGPHLRAGRETVLPLLNALKIDAVTLANNHILDYGRPGLKDTLTALNDARVKVVGAGLSLPEAARPALLVKDDIRVAVLNFAEHEWATATVHRAGANPLDPVESCRQIREARKTSDFVIVIIHGGFEYFPFPSPRMVRQYRFFAENGASVVVGHHPHCLGGHEVHGTVPIFYSLGNFVFTDPSPFECWYTGAVLSLLIEKQKGPSWELVPVRQSKLDYALTLLAGADKEAVVRQFGEYSRTISDDAALGRQWSKFLSDKGTYYLNIFSPMNLIRNPYLKLALTRLGLDRLFRRKMHYAQILNHLRCESHADAARDVLESYLGAGRRL